MFNWQAVKVELEKVANMECKPKGRKLKEGTVINEEKSVRWNREEVERRNKAYLEEVAQLNTAKNKARDAVYDKIYEGIVEEVGHGCTKAKAKLLWDMAYQKGHAAGYSEVFVYLGDLIDLARALLS